MRRLDDLVCEKGGEHEPRHRRQKEEVKREESERKGEVPEYWRKEESEREEVRGEEKS